MRELILPDGTKVNCYEDGSVEWTYNGYGWKKPRKYRTKGTNACKGYLGVRINQKSYRIHRLIAEAFIPKIAGKDQVDHIDRNKRNNCPSNLRWVDNTENQVNTARHDRSKNRYGITPAENDPEYRKALSRERTELMSNITFSDGRRHYVLKEYAKDLVNIPVSKRIYTKQLRKRGYNVSNLC